jgi:hypothetical protein
MKTSTSFKLIKKCCIYLVLFALLLNTISCIDFVTNGNLYVYCNDALYKIGLNESFKPVKEQILKPNIDKYNNAFMLSLSFPPYFFNYNNKKISSSSYLPQINYPTISKDLNLIMNYTYDSKKNYYSQDRVYWIYKSDSKETILLSTVFNDIWKHKKDFTINYAWFSSIKEEIYYLITYNRKTDLWKSDINFKNKVNLTKDFEFNVVFNSESYHLFPPVIISPDEEKILFYTNGGSLYLLLMNIDELKIINVSEEINKVINKGNDFDNEAKDAIFTQDSNKIILLIRRKLRDNGTVYKVERSIWSISTDLTDIRNLTKDMKEMEPYFPFLVTTNGKKIVFQASVNDESDIINKNGDLWSMNIDGSDKKNITAVIETNIGKYYEFQDYSFMSISPDGKKVVFELSYTNDIKKSWKYTLGIANIDGTGVKDLLRDAKVKYPELEKVKESPYRTAAYFYPYFTPDSKNVVFISYNGPDLWIVSNDGKEYENLSKKFDLNLWDGFLQFFVIE